MVCDSYTFMSYKIWVEYHSDITEESSQGYLFYKVGREVLMKDRESKPHSESECTNNT